VFWGASLLVIRPLLRRRQGWGPEGTGEREPGPVRAAAVAERERDRGTVTWAAVAVTPRPLPGRPPVAEPGPAGAGATYRPAPLVEARDLVKRFGDFVAVDGITFEIRPGECFGFLGPNGAGKTSTMRMISCMSPASGGTLRVLGMDPQRSGPAIRARLGLVPQEDSLDLELTVLDNLIIYARYFDIPKAEARRRADELLDFAQLSERAHSRVEPLSGGMRRRLTIARALVSEPDLLILDEPTTGLDPQARHLLWDRLYRLKQQGVTLVITTHYMDEAEQLCDRLVVMDRGTIAAEGTPRQLIERYSTREVVELRFAGGEDERAAIELGPMAERVEALPDRLLLYADDGDAVLADAHRRGFEPVSGLVRRSTLEDVFLHLTGRSLVD
jgi:lipooligosaccharide transport system ATP-binding protein